MLRRQQASEVVEVALINGHLLNGHLLRRSAGLGLVAGWLALGSGSVLANVIVFESSVPGIRLGQDLPDDHQLNIPFGTHLVVIAGQDSKLKQIQINGPRAGRVSELLNPEPLPARLLNLLMRTAQTGGADETGTAAARGRSAFLLLNDVAIEPNAAVCIEEGSSPKIALAPGAGDTAVRVTDHQGMRSAALELKSGSGATWPASIAIRDGGLYRVVATSMPQIEFKLRLVPTGGLGDLTSVQAIDALDARGCKHQVTAALRKIMAAQ